MSAPVDAGSPAEAEVPGSRRTPRRLDVFRRGSSFLCVARATGVGSLATVFEGDLPDVEREELGALALEWLEVSRTLDAPERPLRFPEDLLPEGWQAGHWYDFMRFAQLCAVEWLEGERLCLRPYKNLDPVGEEFSHEGGHALDCLAEPRALGAGLLAALDVSGAISQVMRSPHLATGPPRLAPQVVEELGRLGANLFERSPRAEMVEVADGFFHLPPALRQLLFDAVWRRSSRLRDAAGTIWDVRWFSVSTLTDRRAWPLMCLAANGDAEIVVRLDTDRPSDPAIYQLAAGDDAETVLGRSGGPAAAGIALSRWLSELEPA